MKNKKLFFAIIAFLIVLVIVFIIIMIIRKNFLDNNIVDNDGNVVIEEEPLGDSEDPTIYEKERLTNNVYFFSIEHYINEYLDAISSGAAKNVMNRLSENYIKENNLTENNILSNIEKSYEFIATEIYETRNKTLYSYVVKGVKDDGIYNENKYYLFDLDLSNYTYAITPLFNNNYTDINQIPVKTELKSIEKNNHNSFEYLRLNNDEIFTKYAEYYINLLKNNPSKAYEMMDEEYKKARFGNIYGNYTNYITMMINNNKIDTEIKEITKYSNDNKTYLVKTKNDNRYIIKQNYPMNFTVQLDEYTIESDSYKKAYSSATDVKKLSTNVDKIMKMINNYDYQNLYNLLDDNYKENNDINSFIKYIQEKFYNSNFYEITEIITGEESNTLGIKVYKDNSSNSEYNLNKILMVLGEGTDFKFSFV